jgi:hypothetical protein
MPFVASVLIDRTVPHPRPIRMGSSALQGLVNVAGSSTVNS